MAKTYYLENALLSEVLRNVNYVPPTAVYVALFTATPGPGGGGTEVAGGMAYARQAAAFSAPTNGSLTNSADVTFPQATGAWGTISYFGLFDDPSAGNLLYYGSLTASKTIASGDQLKFAAGGITVTES